MPGTAYPATRTPPASVPLLTRHHAGFWVRAAALLLDGILLVAVELIIAAFFIMSDRGAVIVSLGAVYYILGAASGGTLGKRVLRLRIVTAHGVAPGLLRGFARGLVEAVSCLVALLGFLSMLWDENKQTWHDRLSGTYVVRVQQLR